MYVLCPCAMCPSHQHRGCDPLALWRCLIVTSQRALQRHFPQCTDRSKKAACMSGMLSIDPPHAFRVPSSLRARPAQSADLACCPCATVRSQQEYFSKFGELTDVVVMMSGQGPDRHPRGFGFVTFANPAALDLVGCQRYHSIGNRKVEVKRALSREVMQGVKASAVPESVERHMAANAGWQPHAPLNAPANTAIYGTMQQGVYDNNHAYINNSGWVHQVQPTCGAPRLQALAMMPVGLPTSVPAIMPVGVPIDNGYMPPSYMGYAPVVDDGYMPPHMGYAPMKAGTMTTMAPPSPTMVVNGDGYVSPHMGYAPIKVGTMTTMAPPSPTMVVYSTGMMC